MNNILSTQVLFVDAAVADIDALLAQVDPAIEVIRLEAGQDGLIQIAQALAGRSGIEAVHVVSHGAPGALTLGGTTLDAAALEQQADALATLRAALTDDADLLLYGCNVAQGDAGQAFIRALADATGADVAASENLTGASWLGGDWVLEATTGDIEAAAIAAPAMDATLYSSGGIFNNGYIKFGWSHDGTFGYGSNKSPGIFYDTAGTGNFPSNADFLTPGSPFEFFSVKIGSSTYVNNNTSYTSPKMATTTDTSGVVTAEGKTYGTLKFISTINGLEITQTYTLGATDQVISISVSVRNTTEATIYDVKYARGIDPDVDSPLGTTSTHNVRGAGDIAATDIVLGTGPISSRVIGLYTNSSLEHNTNISRWSTDPAALLKSSSNNTADDTINLAFNLGDLAAGQTKNFSLAYVFAANAAALADSVAQVPASNPAPTLTDFAAPVDTIAEDGTVEVTFAELAAQGNEADLNADESAGSVTAFVVKGVTSGTLKIGTSVETATAWAPSSNDVIDGTLKAYWTPAANANGELVAFTVVARDAEGAVSATPVAVQVTVTAVNDAPTLASHADLPAVLEDAAVNAGASVASIFTPRFADVDVGDMLGGIIVAGNAANPSQGQWQYSTDGGANWYDIGVVTAANGLALAADAKLRFAPAPDRNGTPGGLAVHVADSAYTGGFTNGLSRVSFDTMIDAPTSGVSDEARALNTSVTPVNDAPTFDSADPIVIELSETAGNDTSAIVNAGSSLSGTLTASDVEHDAFEFGIRGGIFESNGTVTKIGAFGTLIVDKVTGEWSYDPTNMVGLNALAEGAIATDSFEFTVVDEHGAQSLKTLTVTLTGTNDQPVIDAGVGDQSFNGIGAWKFQIPANAFADAEGLGLTYTVEVLNGNGDVITTPPWLTFDAATRTLTGTPPNGSSLPLTFKVTAVDGPDGLAVSDTFTLKLDAPTYADHGGSAWNLAPTSTNARVAAPEAGEYFFIVSDFGNFADAEGSPLAAIQITALPAQGTLMYSLDGYWFAVEGGQQISAADIAAGRLKFEPDALSAASDYATIEFRVSDGTAFSAGIYSLHIDVEGEATVAAASLQTAALYEWTQLYGNDQEVLTGFHETTVEIEITGGHLKFDPSAVDFELIDPIDADLVGGTSTRLVIKGFKSELNEALKRLQVTREDASASLTIDAIDTGGKTASRTITLEPLAAPVLSISGAASYTEHAPALALAPALSITDIDSDTLASAAVTIVAGRGPNDYLVFTNDGSTMGNIAASYNAGTGVLTLTSSGASATLAQWEAALKAVAFGSNSEDAGGTRTIAWRVDDNAGTSSFEGYTTVAVTAVNDAPTVTHLGDVTVAAGVPLGLDIGSPFSDPEGGVVTYSATLADGSPLPAWLSFDAATHVFSGNPPAGVPFLNLKVIGTDDQEASAFTTFTLNLANEALGASAANNAGTVAIAGTPTQGETLSAQAPVDADGNSGAVTYQWQVSSDGGTTWADITGSRGSSDTLTLEKTESGKQVRVQAFYNDEGGAAEAPVSAAVSVENINDAGSVTINGVPIPGQTWVATISDGDGLLHATPTYQWFRDGVAIAGATYSAYTLTNEDGGTHVGVGVTYTDDQGMTEGRVFTKPELVQLGATAPVAGNDTATALEAGGLDNATPGSNASGNLLANDSDANPGDTLTITGVRMGATEGLGRPGSESAGEWVIVGDYGTLRVNKATGAYTYEVDQDNGSVQAMGPGDTLTETFNYTVSDATALSDTALLTITLNGANDLATVAGLSASATVAEDVPTALPLALTITDPDGSGSFALRLHVDAGTLRAVSGDAGVTVSGSDTGTLTITAGSPFALQGWLADNQVLYITEPNVHGSDIATLTYSLDDGSGAGFVALPGTTAITSTDTNDAAIVDLDGATPGNNYTTTFRPRGSEVAVVADSVTITDIDPADGLMSAVVTLAGGDFDNAFGTVYETLRSSAGDAFEGSLGTIEITGNGTGHNGLTGATRLTFTGAGTQADYQDALKTVFYSNANPNAFSGDRTITVTVSDSVMQESDASLFSILVPNTDIAVGQRIFIDGEDSGYTVASKVDDQHFVASGPLAGLDAGSTLTFYSAGVAVTSATQSGPTIATTTVLVPWTPVIDMSGESLAGRDHGVTYTEGQPGVAIAMPDASITDQDGNIATVTVTLTNPVDGVAEQLSIAGTLVTQLLGMGITVAGNGTHQITLSGDKDATFFQIGLRGIKYTNTADHPDADTQRIVEVTSEDIDGNTGVGARTFINLVAVNDAPTGADHTLTTLEDSTQVLGVTDFGYADVEGDAFASITVVSLPGSGSLVLDGVAVTAGQRITVADIVAGKLAYVPAADASGAARASFQFKVQDDGGTANGGVELAVAANTLTFDITPVNDAPVMQAAAPALATITEDDVANAGHLISDFVGAGVGKTGASDVDALNNGGAGYAPEAVGQGIAIHALANDGPATGGRWEYSLDDGDNWTAVGTVGEGSALLLASTDKIRFVPDGENATAASFSYYLWDGATGTAGDYADAGVRGGTSAYSEGSDTAHITVTPVNDAPTIDLNGAGGGTGYTTVFRPRGDAVAIVADGIVIGDVDRLDADTPDTLASATVRIAGGALDNLFGTIFETLSSTVGTYEGSLGAIAITGNGTGEKGLTGATELTLTGAGTHADYEAALKTVEYHNANPNAYSGDRTIEITVRDASVSTGDAGHGTDSAVATTTIQVPWTPVIDMNGDAAPGRHASVVYTEGSAGVAIAAADASVVDQDGNIASVTVTLTNPLDGVAEKLSISTTLVTQLASVGITISGNGSHAITLSGNRDGTVFQLALRAIRYVNESDDPDTTPRVVNVESVDMQGNTGVGAHTVINVIPVNDAPQGVDGTVTLDEDTSHAFALADFGHTDAEGDALAEVIITTLPASGSLTLDGVAVSAGQAIAAADIVAGKLVYTPVPDANGAPATHLTFQVRDAGGTANGGSDLDASPNTLTLDIDPVNDQPTGSDPDTAPSVAITGSLREGATLTAAVDIADVDRSGPEIDGALAYQWQSRAVPDGTWDDIVGATGATHALTPADTNREIRVVVTYTDVVHPESSFTYASDWPGRPAIAGDVNGDITLVLATDTPVVVFQPEGDVTVTNTGHGPLAVDGLPNGGTLTVGGPGETTVSNPEGDATIVNGGAGTVRVTDLADSAELTTSGDGNVTIQDPTGGVDLINQGPGTVTVTGLGDGETLDASGDGPTTVADPVGDLTIANAGDGTVTATGVKDGSVVTTSGFGPITIDDPEGSLELVNHGNSSVTVEGLDDGQALVVSGTGHATVANPDGDLTLTNNGTGYATVTGAADDATITAAGTGSVLIRYPQGDLTLVNNQTGDGDVFVDSPQDGAGLNISGAGPTTVSNPDGDLTIENAGPGRVTAKCLLDGKTVTTYGAGDVLISQPRGSVGLVNNQTDGGTVTVSSVNSGQTVDVSGSGATRVSSPDGDVTVSNTGTGLVTTAGVQPDRTVTFEGDGPQALDLAGFPDGREITLDNAGGANVEVLHAPQGAIVHANGSGDLTVTGPVGDIHIDNRGAGTVHVDAIADGATLTKTGSGPAVIDHPAGGFTLDNDDTGLVTVRGLDAGQTLVVEGSGPVAVESNLASGERVTVDARANGNVQLSNTGAGTIDVLGDLRLDAGDPVRINLSGDGATALTVEGEVSLDGTPLDLQLDAAYAPHLGDTITLLDNDGVDAIGGTFAGLPEGAPIYLGGQLFRISYTGGSGNDVVLTRVNDGPSGSVTVSGTVAQGETLTASHSLADTDGLGTVRYQWLVDGAMVAMGSSYVVTQAAVGKAITVVATYTDAQGTEESVSSTPTAPVANVNDAPTGTLLIGGTAALGQSLVVTSTLADADGMGPVSYQWQADGVDIAGATGDSLRIGGGEIGKLISVIASYTDGHGALERVVASAAVSVADGNGVAPEIESQVPSLGGGASGDGNGDGVVDTLQPAVVSAALAKQGGGAPSTFVTLVVDSVDGKVKEGSTARLVDFKPLDASGDLPSWAELPAGEIGFTATVDAPGVAKNFSLYVDADLGVNGYWAKNADGVLVNLASEAYGGALVREGDKIRLDFQITEGGEFDLGAAGDTSIVAAGAVGYAVLGLIGHVVDTPDVAPGTNIWD